MKLIYMILFTIMVYIITVWLWVLIIPMIAYDTFGITELFKFINNYWVRTFKIK